ncbi:MAG: hypothetical protein ABJA78_03695 [Ferruginibacter sp.]
MQAITIYDYILLPFYLLFFYLIVLKKAQQYNGTGLKKIFITGFSLKMGGAILYALVFQYYYGYGDSFGYYRGSLFIRNLICEGPDYIKNLFLSGAELTNAGALHGVDPNLMGVLPVEANAMVMKISSLISFPAFNYYLIIALFFTFFSFAGAWRLYCTFNEIMKNKSPKLLAWLVLYSPSMCFWASGLNKEAICMGSIGFISNILYRIIIQKKISIRDLFIFGICFYMLYMVKDYLAVLLLVSLAAAFLGYYIIARKNFFSKFIVIVVLLLISISVFIYTVSKYTDWIVEESTSIIETSKAVYSVDDEGSMGNFTVEDFDVSLTGLIIKTPAAIFSTLYRPLFWETKKPMMMFSALESFSLMIATLFLIIKLKFFRFFSTIFSDPYLIFSFTFCILMGVVVGLTTFNFGTLVRYRLPLLPFYFFLLFAVYQKNKSTEILKEA